VVNFISPDFVDFFFCCCFCHHHLRCCHLCCFCCCLYQQVDSIFSEASRLLEFIRTVTFSFSSLRSLLTVYCTVVRLKLEYASVVWNSITSSDVFTLEHIQRKCVSLCCFCIFTHLDYGNVLITRNYTPLHGFPVFNECVCFFFFKSNATTCPLWTS
jgi:hypothetical protein